MEIIDNQVIKLFVRGLMFHLSWDLLLVWPVEFFLAWNAPFWQKLDEYVGRFSVSILLRYARRDVEWVVSGYFGIWATISVYEPHNANDRVDFWLELTQVAGEWNRVCAERRLQCYLISSLEERWLPYVDGYEGLLQLDPTT